jgi:hypothetical protein
MASVAGGVAAAYGISEIFNLKLHAALIIVLSSALAAATVIGICLRKPRDNPEEQC